MLNIINANVPEPYPHQKEGMALIEKLKNYALFMDVGTGKSKLTIMRIMQLVEQGFIDSLIVICPNSLKEQWVEEQFPEHYSYAYSSFVWNGMSTKKEENKFHAFIGQKSFKVFSINVEAFQYAKINTYVSMFLNACRSTKVVVDEATTIKNPTAKRTKSILKLFRNIPYKAILTGTPTPNTPFELYSQFEFLSPNFWRMSYFQFQHRYGILIKQQNKDNGKYYHIVLPEKTYMHIKKTLSKSGTINSDILENLSRWTGVSIPDIMYITKMNKYQPYKYLDKLDEKIESFTFKKTQEQCLSLPPSIYENLNVEMNSEQKRLYKELKKDFITSYEGNDLTVVNKIGLTLRLQMVTGGLFPLNKEDLNTCEINSAAPFKLIANSPKIRVLMEDIERLPEDKSIIIWAIFQGEIELIYNALNAKGYSCAKYYGKTLMKDRPEIVTNFKNKQLRIFIANPGIAGEGLNLQVCYNQYFYSSDYRAAKRMQAEARSRRSGQEHSVIFKDIIAKNSIDQHIHRAIKNKQNIIDYFRGAGSVEMF